MIDFEALRREMERNPEMFINPEESRKKKAKEAKQAQKEKQDKQAKQVNKNNSQCVKVVCIQKFRDKVF